jgi:xylulose-5-phosphate/fructose-6-phosphate phosphoketolase
MIYLRDNPLLREPLKEEHLKNRLLGHWGASPGLAFMYCTLNRIILEQEQEAIFLAGPGHGAPGVLAPVYLEGTYSEIYPNKSEDEDGHARLLQAVLVPRRHRLPLHAGDPRVHPRGRRARLLHQPRLRRRLRQPGPAGRGRGRRRRVRDRPAGHQLALSKFLNPIRDGAVLPILHLNGYKINNPTLLSRIPNEELASLMRGYGWTPHFVEGDDPMAMHQPWPRPWTPATPRSRSSRPRPAPRARPPALPLADDRAAHAQGLDRPEGGRRPQGRGLLARPPGAAVRHAQQPRAPEAARGLDEAATSPEELFDETGRLNPEIRAAGAPRARCA